MGKSVQLVRAEKDGRKMEMAFTVLAGLLIYTEIKKTKNEHLTFTPTPGGLVLQGRF